MSIERFVVTKTEEDFVNIAREDHTSVALQTSALKVSETKFPSRSTLHSSAIELTNDKKSSTCTHLPSSTNEAELAGNNDQTKSPASVESAKLSTNSVPSVSDNQASKSPFQIIPAKNPGYALFEDEMQERPRLATFLSAVADYSNLSTPNKVKLGTIMGVYLPCVQNILGVILFVRMTWIVGLAGIMEGFFIVFLCVCTTLNTSISMSAIATNGVVPAGGSYFMISRALGPEFGGAVGLLFYLGTTYASSLYILGAVEILLTYMAPELSLFGDFRGPENRGALFNNYRVYGTIFLTFMTLLVFVGVKLVNKFASLFLACVIISIISIFGGIIKSAFLPPDITICFLGNRLLRQLQGDGLCAKFFYNTTTNISEPTSLYRQHCSLQNDTVTWLCDPFFDANNVTQSLAVPGLGSVSENVFSMYLVKEDPISTNLLASRNADSQYSSPPWVVADLTSTFTILLAIFFPSVTDLCSVVFFGLCVHGALLRDKFGESIGDELIVSIISWPNKWVVLVGAFLSTIGAGLQSLTGAPRLLQAIAKDDIIPILKVFATGKKNGEPTWALLLTFLISFSGIAIANLDLVAPILTMFFLMCYMFVNLACALHSLLDTPNWRPRYKYYHWFLSLIGACLCIALMFISSWYYALAALVIAGIIYKYIEYSGAEKEWGDGLRGLKLTTARFALLRLASGQPHTKNWRPQLLVLLKLDSQHIPDKPGILAFASQLKAGKGLVVVASVLEGNSFESYQAARKAEQNISKQMEIYKVKGFEQVLVSRSAEEGISALIQTAGLGGLSPNTVVIGWPYNVVCKGYKKSYNVFLRAVREASAQQKAILVLKYIDTFPTQHMKSTIDVWWIVHDGGLLMLLPFLLKQHKIWKNCKFRIFTVAQIEDNSVQMKKDLENFLYHLRIAAKVEVVEMQDSDISAYTYERTLRMEQRTEILSMLQMSKRDSDKDDIFGNNAAAAFKLVHMSICVFPKAQEFLRHDDSLMSYFKKVSEVVQRSRHSYFLNKVHPSGYKGPLDEDIDEEGDVNESGVDVAQRTWTRPTEKSTIPVVLESGLEGNRASFRPSDQKETPKTMNVRRMHTAIRLNESILNKSRGASLVIVNLPGPPKGITPAREANYIEYIEVLTEGIDRVLMVRGGGREVITMYS